MKSMIGGIVLLASVLGMPASSAENPGKAVFDKTCKQCHGPEGKGNVAADKFYEVKIPRLNSDYVQRKSDDEIREIITQGRRKMRPVRMGQPVAEHKLEPSEVGDVIAYVRTLKKAAAAH